MPATASAGRSGATLFQRTRGRIGAKKGVYYSLGSSDQVREALRAWLEAIYLLRLLHAASELARCARQPRFPDGKNIRPENAVTVNTKHGMGGVCKIVGC